MSDNPYAVFSTPEYYCGNIGYRPGADGQGYRDFEPNNTIWAEYIASKRPVSVLDMGCGWGYLVRKLRQRGIEAWGVDISSVAMERAPEDVKPYLCRGNIADLTCLPEHFPKEFDFSCSFGVLEHLTLDDVKRCCREIHRISRRGVHAIGLSTEWSAHLPVEELDKTHRTMRDYTWWRRHLPEPFEVWEGSQETWEPVSGDRLKVLVITPSAYPVGGGGYGGIERLAFLLSRELARRGFAVSLAAPAGSLSPWGVMLVETGPAHPQDFVNHEYRAFNILMPGIRQFNVILDLSHSHWAGRLLPWHTRQINPIWHAPDLMQPPEPRWNVTALSEWQAFRYLAHQGHPAQVLDIHILDNYQPQGQSGDRFLVVGRVNRRKGVLEAIQFCQDIGVGLDIVGPLGEDPQYNEAVLAKCRDRIDYLGELPYRSVLELAAQARALLYPSQEPEAHSHKMVDALSVGCPCITWGRYAYPEVVEHGVDGYLAQDDNEFKTLMRQVDRLDRADIACRARARWGAHAVGDRLAPVLVDVSRGARWS